jgi:hypothetical protein
MPYIPSLKRFNQAVRNFDKQTELATKKLNSKDSTLNSDVVEHLIKQDYWSNITAKNNPDRYYEQREKTDQELWKESVNKYKDIYVQTKFFPSKRK